MKRDLTYQWQLTELMARYRMHNSTDFARLLREPATPHAATSYGSYPPVPSTQPMHTDL